MIERVRPWFRRPVVVAGVALVVVALVGGVLAVALRPGEPAAEADAVRLRTAIDRLEDDSKVPVEVAVNDGFPGAVLARVDVDGATPTERALDYLADRQDLYGLDGATSLVIDRVMPLGASTARSVSFRQVHRGVPVFGGEIAVTVTDAEAFGSTGRLRTDLDVDVAPRITADEAEVAARDAAAGAPVAGATSLVIYDPALIGAGPNPARLAWFVTIGGASSAHVFVDAIDGTVLQRLDLAQGGFAADIRTADNATSARLSGCYTEPTARIAATDAGLDPAFEADADVRLALDEARATHAFFERHFGRDSYDGLGSRIRIVVDAVFEDGAPNAFWIGGPCGVLEFSDGFVTGDVLTHEFTHALVEHTAGLVYFWLSGALNESYADVFAFLRTGDPVIGEDLPISAIRDLRRPDAGGQPDRLSELRPLERGLFSYPDNGWVHYNSGIPNLAAYLLARGGTHPDTGISVTGIGDDRTADVYFASLASLTSTADFVAQRIAVQQAAIALGFDAAQLCDVRNAFAAVEVGVGDADCDGGADPGDRDGDFIVDSLDICPDIANTDQADADGDGIGDACDADRDGDGLPQEGSPRDNCPDARNPDQTDRDGDGSGSLCDPDEDADPDRDDVSDADDNCPEAPNESQSDTDGDRRGDVCDPDLDGDGIDNGRDNCPAVVNPDQTDVDGDGAADPCDPCPAYAGIAVSSLSASGATAGVQLPPTVDRDGDGTPDICEPGGFGVAIVELPDGTPWLWDLAPTPEGDSETLVLFGRSGERAKLALPVCVGRCATEPPPDTCLELRLTQVNGAVAASVIDNTGLVVADGPPPGPDRSLRFQPRGGRSYVLEFAIGPAFEDTDEFTLTYRTCRTGEVPPEPATSPEPTASPGEFGRACDLLTEAEVSGLLPEAYVLSGRETETGPRCTWNADRQGPAALGLAILPVVPVELLEQTETAQTVTVPGATEAREVVTKAAGERDRARTQQLFFVLNSELHVLTYVRNDAIADRAASLAQLVRLATLVAERS